MAENVTLYPIGVGDAFTVKHWFSTFKLNVDGRELFVDAPAYIPKMLADNNANGEEQIGLEDYKELLITHLHADHVGGVEELAYLQYFKTENPIKLYGPKWLLQDLWSHLRPALEESAREEAKLANFDWFFDPIAIDEKHDFGGFTVEQYEVKVHVPRTIAYKFDFGNFKLGFSSDTGFDRDLIAWLDDADLVLHEVRVGSNDVLGGDLRVLHTALEDLLTLPESFQRKTLLFHYADDAYDTDPEQPNYDLGHYRLLQQGKTYQLVENGQPVDVTEGAAAPA